MISGYLVGDRQLVAQLGALPKAIQDNIAKTVDMLGLRLIANVVTQKLSGQVLKRRTGRLAASIARGGAQTRSKFEQTSTTAIAYVGTNVTYGRTWEYGAHVPAYEIRPKNGQALHFFSHGAEIFAKVVHMPARDIKARPYLAPALQEMKPQIIAEIQRTLTQTVKDGLRK